jgi:flagellin-like protein
MKKKYPKKSQSELITTVLLILISIAAVVLVSSYVMNIIKNNLKNTDCFQTTGQLEINMDNTYYKTSDTNFYFSIERGTKEFNLSGIAVSYGNSYTTKTVKIIAGETSTEVYYYDNDGTWKNTLMKIPQAGEKRAYKISSTSAVTKLSIAPIMIKGTTCDKTDEADVSSV